MKLSHWNPWGDIGSLHRDLDRFFVHQGASQASATRHGFSPAADVHEGEEGYTLSFDLPGVPMSEVHIEVHQGRLTVRGERSLEQEGYSLLERKHGAFQRAFTLPDNVDAEGIGAQSKDGVLTITLPKMPEAQPTRIEIQG